MDEVNLREVRQSIAEFIEAATIDHRVIDALRYGDKLVPKECDLWDYKEQLSTSPALLAETILEIISFYNAYGGYILYGVRETKDDTEFIPIGIRQGSVDSSQLKQLVKNYTGDEIDFSYVELFAKFAGQDYLIGLLHVPKRSHLQPPTIFGKNGPEDKPGHSIFKKGSIYVRIQDKCIPAETKYHLQFICGKRGNPFLLTSRSKVHLDAGLDVLAEHNLPDRSFICPRFFGRDEILGDLWRWLTDDLSRTKVLAGDGGKGKTSIAYQFAEEVCRTRPYGIEKVVWLTAKTKQFKGELDRFVPVPRTDFFDTESMLRSLCSELAVLDTETKDATIPLLQKLLKNALSNISCLIVIDDVDSTEPNEQRMILETAMQFPNLGGRFLLTTRMNITYSSALCITVGGLSEKDYGDLINHLTEELHIPPLMPKKIHRMWGVTDGSPLYTESLLRLCHLGMPMEDAMREWKGKLGTEVRKAALRREIDCLLMESRRVALACALMGEASLTELKKATGYENERMMICLEELKSLFLVNAKPIIKQEPRFVMSNNTARLILENKETLVADPVALEKAIVGLRRGRAGKNTLIGRRYVESAIAQAMALIRDGRRKDALETVETALKNYRDNPDLLFARGRCLMELAGSDKDNKYLTMTRKAFSKAYDAGQRKEMLYELWYKCEMIARHPQGVIEICSLALRDGLPSQSLWFRRRAKAHDDSSLALQQSFNVAGAINEIQDCISDLSSAISYSGPLEKTGLQELLFQASDDLWEIGSSSSQDIVDLRELFKRVKYSIGQGDSRLVNLERLLRTAERLYRAMQRFDGITRAQANLLRQIVRETGEVIAAHISTFSEKEMMENLHKKWRELDSATIHLD